MAEQNPILNRAKEQQTDPESTAPASVSKLSAVEDALAVSGKRITKSIAQQEANIEATERATTTIKSAISDVSAANQITARADLNARLQEQKANVAGNVAAGSKANQIRLIEDLRADGDRVADLLDKRADILDDNITGFFPLDAIINAIRIAPLEINLDAAQEQEAQTVNQIRNITGAQEAFAQVNAITKKTLNEGVIEANLKAITADSRKEAAKVELENMHANSAAMTSLLNADSRNVSNLIQSFRLEGEAAERKLAVERQAFAREQMAFQREKFAVELPQAKVNLESSELRLKTAIATNPTDRTAAIANNNAAVKRFNDAVALEAQVTDSVQRAQSTAGIPLETREVISFKLTNPATRDKYIRLQELGGVPNPVLGLNPAEAQENLSLIDESGTATKTTGTKLLKQIMDLQLEKYRQTGAVIPKDIESRKSDFNNTAAELTGILTKDIRTGDASNPYSAPPMSVLSTKASVINTPLFQKVLKAKDMQETNPQRIMDAALEGVSAKVITPEEAASGIEAIFEAAAAHNNTFQGGFTRVGLPAQDTYNVKLDRVPTAFETLRVLPTLANPFTLPGKVLASEAPSAGEFIESQVGAFVTVDLMNETDIQQAIAIILSTARPIPVPTAAELEVEAEAKAKKARRSGIIGETQ